MSAADHRSPAQFGSVPSDTGQMHYPMAVYHGTSTANAHSIAQNGPQMNDNNGHYGAGLYVTTDMRRAMEYADPMGNREGSVMTMILHPRNPSMTPVHDPDTGEITKTVPEGHDVRKLGTDDLWDPLHDDYSVLNPSAMTVHGIQSVADIKR